MKTLRTQQHQLLLYELKKARIDAKLTQSQLAKKLGKPQSYIAKIEGGERRLDVVEFVNWVKACGSIEKSGKICKYLSEAENFCD